MTTHAGDTACGRMVTDEADQTRDGSDRRQAGQRLIRQKTGRTETDQTEDRPDRDRSDRRQAGQRQIRQKTGQTETDQNSSSSE